MNDIFFVGFLPVGVLAPTTVVGEVHLFVVNFLPVAVVARTAVAG